MDVISLASFCALFSCIYLAPEHQTYFIWPCILACLVTNICSVRLAAYLADGLHANLERKNLQLQKNYYEELEHNQNQIRKFRHDMNNHLSVVGNLLDEGNLLAAKEYFNSISGYMQTANRKFYQNSVVNAVINAKYQLMTNSSIDMFLNIELTNSKSNEIFERKGRLLSDKEDQSAHGIGISSVKEIVDKYDGTLDISYAKDWFKVVILIGS